MLRKTAKAAEPLLAFNLREALNMTDLSVLGILSIYTTLALLFYPAVPNASVNILLNMMIAMLIIALAIGDVLHGGTFFRIARRYYAVPVIYLMYQQVHSYVPILHPRLYDDTLIRLDHALFGVNPTQWIDQFSFPALTEYLQITYMSFYFLPIMHGIELTITRQESRLNAFVYMITFGFIISYLLYFFVPAVGPRFTLHSFATMNTDLPGLWLTNTLRGLVNAGGSLTPTTPNPIAIVNRDCMPSGHTMMTMVNIILAYRYHSRLRWVFYIIGGSLIFATIYLRYHYVVDIIAGEFCAFAVLYMAPKLQRWVHSKGFIQA